MKKSKAKRVPFLCPVCLSPRKEEVETLLVTGCPVWHITEMTDIGERGLNYHVRHHLYDKLKQRMDELEGKPLIKLPT